MLPESIPIRVKLRVLLDVRKHMALNDEEFRQLLINVLREHMDNPSSWDNSGDFAAVLGDEMQHAGPSAPRVQLASAALDDELRDKAVDDFIAAARRLVAESDESEESTSAY